MALDNGARLGRYEIVGPLGAGGMGEVYKARDTRLHRTVAVKVLPHAIVADAESRARLQREARAIAALSHPHICVLHDVGTENDVDYLVLEHLDGETLAERLRADRPRLTIEAAINVAIQMADALAVAHAAGIVHRDLKPANIFILLSGADSATPHAKLLDFGLAKSVDSPFASPDGPTIDAAPTERGTIMGTCQYMAPEQVEGRAADARSDVFAFGAVVYEMLSGHKAFPADSATGAMTAVLRDTPASLSRVDPPVLPSLEWVVRRCLEKNPDARWQSMRDVSLVLRQVATGALDAAPRPVAASATRRSLLTAAAVGLAALAFVGGYLARSSRRGDAAPAASQLRLSIVAPSGTVLTARDITAAPQFALSPDGSRIAVVAGAQGERARIWIRPLDSTNAVPLPGTEDASGPFWAPDGRALGFFAGRKLKRISAEGGAAQDLADVAFDVVSGDWNADGTILFGGATGAGLFRVSANGGPVQAATQLNAGRSETGHRAAQFLPDGRHFLFFARSAAPANIGIYVGSLDAPAETTHLIKSSVAGVFLEPHSLIFEQAGTVMVQDFDPQTRTLSGTPVAFPDRFVPLYGSGMMPVSVGAGTMAYWNGDRTPAELLWFDRHGTPLGRLGDARLYAGARLSRGGSSLLVTRHAGADSDDVWSFDVASGVESRLTFGSRIGSFGVWAPDAKALAFSHNRGAFELHLKNLDGSPDRVVATPSAHFAVFPEDWSADGRWLIYGASGSTAWDLNVLNLVDGSSRPLLATASNEIMGRLSPDGRWLAYTSDESGRWDVYVSTFPDGAGKWQVSTDGGWQPEWRGDGKELFFIARDGRLTAAAMRGGAALEIGGRQPLFDTHLSVPLAPFRGDYAVMPDGQRFLITTAVPNVAPQTITVVLNRQTGSR